MGIIMAPLAAGIIVGLRTSDEASNRLSASNDAQLVSLYFPPDVHSTGSGAGDVVVAPTPNTECSGTANVVRLTWRAAETGGATTTYVAAYAVTANPNGGWRLVRYVCTDGGAPSAHVVARNLASASAATASAAGTKVSLTVTEAKTPTESSPYTFTVSGVRRTA
jgi:hypothetical protein